MFSKDDKWCVDCAYFYKEEAVNYYECENEEISEELTDKHFSLNVPNCPYWKEVAR